MGFLCYVCGKTDPSEFFYGMRLTFDGPPHLVQLKQAIEARAVQDNALPDGSRYVITDLEVLDLRLNMWTPLDTRAQLYSGCHICAIRDNATATSSGPIDISRKLPQQRALGFALDVESTFRALDAENRGLVSLSNVLHVFRHDLNYAVEFFQMIDVRNCGQVTMQDLMSATAKKTSDFWKELQLRISRGGLDPGIQANRAGLAYLADSGSAHSSGGASPLRPGSPRTPMLGGGAKGGTLSAGMNSSNAGGRGGGEGGVTPTRRQGIAAAILATAKQQKDKEEQEKRQETSSLTSTSGGRTNINNFGSGGGSTPSSPADSKAVASARKVVELFQRASRPGTPPVSGKGFSGAMAKMKELATKASSTTGKAGPTSAASISGSNSTASPTSPVASARNRKS